MTALKKIEESNRLYIASNGEESSANHKRRIRPNAFSTSDRLYNIDLYLDKAIYALKWFKVKGKKPSPMQFKYVKLILNRAIKEFKQVPQK